ncbi:acyltransferase [Neobacillus sp. KR4-4]|uniref:acyltransferase n=1 Tax=Neobacillus sp. KR4-4 TaxID=3344872 RepID=UPI0035CB7C80
MRVFKLLKYIISFPKIVYFNFKVFDFHTALKLPVFLHYHVKFGNLYKGCVEIKQHTLFPGMIKLGCGMGSPGVFTGSYPRYSGGGFIGAKTGGKIVFEGKAQIAGGFSLKADNGGIIYLGDNFTANSYSFISANKLIKFGKDCTLGWNVSVRDVDGHDIFLKDDDSKVPINHNREVIIGEKVWIAAKVDILKGTVIPDHCVIAYGTLVAGKVFTESNCIIGGAPLKILKHSIDWSV